MTYLEKVGKLLDLPPAKKSEVLLELKSHMAYICDELIAEAMPAEAAESEAENRMGTPEDVAQRLNATHNTTSWKTAIYTALPFMMSALIMLLPTIGFLRIGLTVLTGVVTSLLSIREIALGRRPFWLAPCVAAAMLCVSGVIHYVTVLTSEPGVMVIVRSYLISGLVLAVCALAASLTIHKWRRTMAILFAVQCTSSLYSLIQGPTGDSPTGFPIFVAFGIMIAMLVVFVRYIFEFHRYGSGIQGSLFLLSLLALLPYLLLPISPELRPLSYYSAGVIVLIGIIAVWVARAPTQKGKVRLLKLAVMVLVLALGLPEVAKAYLVKQPIVLIVVYSWISMAISFSLLQSLILWPVSIERGRDRPDPPLAAQ